MFYKIISFFQMEESRKIKVGTLTTEQELDIGCAKYGDLKTGFANWKKDLFKFVTEEFNNSFSSTSNEEHMQALNELSIWEVSSVVSFVFRATWGCDWIPGRRRAMNCLKKAKEMSQGFDEYIGKCIDHVIFACWDDDDD